MRWLIVLLLGLGWALAQRPVDIPFWHTAGPPGQEPLEEIIRDFNSRQRDYRIVPSFVGDYREGG